MLFLVSDDYTAAVIAANSVGYDLVRFTDTLLSTPRVYYILETQGTNYWGTYVYYPEHCRSVVIQSPHPKKDANTGHQGIHVFIESEALFYMVSGTHRCNSSAYSSCSGTTTGCSGTSEPYRASDLAHTVTSAYQKTTQVLLTGFPATHFIQLHGFSKLSTDPYVILSNGTQVTPTPDYLSLFAAKLDEADTSLTFKIAHIDLAWTRLRGFFNTQGRRINDSTDPCTTDATTSAGRFFHVEQEKTKLRDDATGWDKVAYAVINTFPCTMTAIPTHKEQSALLVYPNPSARTVTVELQNTHLKCKDIKIYNPLGALVNDRLSINCNGDGKVSLDMSALPVGVYVLKVEGRIARIVKQ